MSKSEERRHKVQCSCSHGPECTLPWSVHDWSYEAREEQRECPECRFSLVPCGGGHRKETPCTPLMPIVWVRCCRIWPIVPGWPVGRCGICGTVPVEPAAEPTDTCDNCDGTLSQHYEWAGCDPTLEESE